MSELGKQVARGGLRCSLLAMVLGLCSHGMGGQKVLPEIYFPRVVFECTENTDLEACSAADLKQVGWTDQMTARNELAEFTSLVLEEAQMQEPRVKKIVANTSRPLKEQEGKLVQGWRARREREATRPWIIEMHIKVEVGHCYTFTVQARRAGQEDFLYPEHYKPPEWGDFSKMIKQRHVPDVARRLSQVGRDILGVEPSDEH